MKTNADRIRVMTDEELATFLLSDACSMGLKDICKECTQFNAVNCGGNCMPALLKWLKSPAE